MENLMIAKRHLSFKKLMQKHLDKLERINHAEEQAVIDEVTKIKRSHIRRFGRPKPQTDISLDSSIALDSDSKTPM